jgi:hypothetical protein
MPSKQPVAPGIHGLCEGVEGIEVVVVVVVEVEVVVDVLVEVVELEPPTVPQPLGSVTVSVALKPEVSIPIALEMLL